MKKITFILIFPLLLMGCNQNATLSDADVSTTFDDKTLPFEKIPDSELNWITYTSEKYGYTIEAPETWVARIDGIGTEKSSDIEVSLGPAVIAISVAFNVSNPDEKSDLPVLEDDGNLIPLEDQVFDYFKRVYSQIEDDHEFISHTAESGLYGHNLKNESYIVVYGVPGEPFDPEILATIEKIIKSFKYERTP